MARAACRLSAIFCVLVCLSPVVGATPITVVEFQKDDSIAEAIMWSSFTQTHELLNVVEIEKWERIRNEEAVGSSIKSNTSTENSLTIPETQSLILLGIGLAGLAALLRKHPQKSR